MDARDNIWGERDVMSYIVKYSETVDDVELTNEMDGELVGLDGTNIYNHLSVKRNKSFI